MVRRLAPLVWCAVLCCLVGADAHAQEGRPIRLRARAFVPPANVASGLSNAAGAALVARTGWRHVLIQFSHAIDASTLAGLRRAGARPLRYVPDDAVSAAVGDGFDPSRVEGARWIGSLEPGDRISAETANDFAKPFPQHPLTLVEFHPDVDRDAVARALGDVATPSIVTRSLPQHVAVIPTDRVAIDRLAARDEVAWIYPAPASIDRTPLVMCEGIVSAAGLVANYAAMGDGWDGPGLGAARLGYFLSTPSSDLNPLVQLRELTRAMEEWSRYAAIAWAAAPAAATPASVTILWGPTDHGDGFPFAPDTLAHAFYPSPPVQETIAGDVHFNDTTTWGASDPQRWDVFSVALHELGHSLGLVHSDDPDAVMYPLYGGIVMGLSASDIDAIRSLYAPSLSDALPAGWNSTVVGSDESGSATEDRGRFTITAGGRDIWDSSDEFRFVSQTLAGDGDIVAHVDSLSGTHRWSKAGVMIRSTTAPGAPHAFALVSRDRGLAFQRRRTANGLTIHTDGGVGAPPCWLWLSRRGTRIDAYAALDGGDWRLIGSDTIALPRQALFGLAVTNHQVGSTAAAVFSHVSVAAAPQHWTGTDIGAVGRAGSWSMTGDVFRVRGAGADVWGTSDAFQFVWQTVEGDVDIVARLMSVDFTRSWAKAGVMIRAGLDPGAAHAFMLGSAAKGFAFQRRPAPDGPSVHTSAGAGVAPGWLKLSRRGDLITAYRSADGKTWTRVGSDVIAMGRTVLVGLAVSSHTEGVLCAGVFESVTILHP